VNLKQILTQLHRERQLLTEVISALERLLAESGRPRRGRPPKWLKRGKDLDPKPNK